MKRHLPERRLDWRAGEETSEQERALLERYMDATERNDPVAMVRLLREDAFCSMPPLEAWYVGNEAIVAAWVQDGFGTEAVGRLQSVPVSANRQPAVAIYRKRPGGTEYRPLALDVLRFDDGRVAEIVVFGPDVFGAFGLPATM
jgi:RNA polymerase sigma-70 factor (ECF subfamily)